MKIRIRLVLLVSIAAWGCAVRSGPAPLQPETPTPETTTSPETPPPTTPTTPTTTTPAPANPEALLATARAYVGQRHIALMYSRHKDDKQPAAEDGYMLPLAMTSDGGFVFCGIGDTPLVGRLNAAGALLWEVPFKTEGYRAHEHGEVVETRDGHYVGLMRSYVDESGFPTASFVKIGPTGDVVWTLELPTDKHGNTPQIHFGRLGDDGSIRLQGHAYKGKRGKGDRPALRWSGTISVDGTLTDVSLGAPIDWATDDW